MGTHRKGVLMIEGEGDFVKEEDMMRAIEVGHEAIKKLCLGELSTVNCQMSNANYVPCRALPCLAVRLYCYFSHLTLQLLSYCSDGPHQAISNDSHQAYQLT